MGLKLLATRTFGSGVAYLRYEVGHAREADPTSG